MKAMKYLSMLLMMMALSVCMVSCGDDGEGSIPEPEPEGIVGTWKYADEGGSMTYNFTKNGMGSRILVLIKNGNSVSSTENFKYTDNGVGTIKANIENIIYTWTYTLTGDVLMLNDDIGEGSWVLTRM